MVTAPAVTSCVTVRESRCADDGAQVVPAPNMYPEKKDVITSKYITLCTTQVIQVLQELYTCLVLFCFMCALEAIIYA